MNFSFDAADLHFQAEVRHFIEGHLSDDLRRAQDLTPSVYAEPDVSQAWHKILFAKGWVAPGWPREFGGPGWSPTQRYIFELEMSRAGAPLLHPQGLRLVGPVIMKFGSEQQKQFYLPRILSGEDYWCQGYSEPEAGSDLASLKTRAVRAGDEYIVTGTKMWTTHAHHANRMFALVRTSQGARKQEGISFILIDMNTPGISVRPIMTIGGDHEVNQIFLDDVRVPAENLVGEEGRGWSYGKYLLEFERGGAIVSGRLRRSLQKVEGLGREYSDGDEPMLHDPVIARRLSEIEIDIDAVEMLELRMLSASQHGGAPGASLSSILKLRVSQLHQEIARLSLDLIGTDALVWEGHRPLYRLDAVAPLSEAALPVASRYLNTRAYTIFGGSSEIQHDIIANAVIGT
jgi:acyl-CoA dehydrogenase